MSNTIKIFNRDEDTIITANAVKDDGTAYDPAEITKIEILRTGPRNDPTIYDIVEASFTTGNEFEGTILGTLPKEGYWGFQFRYTLSANSKPVYSKIFYEYVGGTITGNVVP